MPPPADITSSLAEIELEMVELKSQLANLGGQLDDIPDMVLTPRDIGRAIIIRDDIIKLQGKTAELLRHGSAPLQNPPPRPATPPATDITSNLAEIEDMGESQVANLGRDENIRPRTTPEIGDRARAQNIQLELAQLETTAKFRHGSPGRLPTIAQQFPLQAFRKDNSPPSPPDDQQVRRNDTFNFGNVVPQMRRDFERKEDEEMQIGLQRPGGRERSVVSEKLDTIFEVQPRLEPPTITVSEVDTLGPERVGPPRPKGDCLPLKQCQSLTGSELRDLQRAVSYQKLYYGQIHPDVYAIDL